MIINSAGKNYAVKNKNITNGGGSNSDQIQDKVVDYNAKIQEQERQIRQLEEQMKELKRQHDAQILDIAFTELHSMIETFERPLREDMMRRLNGPSLPYPTNEADLRADMMRRL